MVGGAATKVNTAYDGQIKNRLTARDCASDAGIICLLLCSINHVSGGICTTGGDGSGRGGGGRKGGGGDIDAGSADTLARRIAEALENRMEHAWTACRCSCFCCRQRAALRRATSAPDRCCCPGTAARDLPSGPGQGRAAGPFKPHMANTASPLSGPIIVVKGRVIARRKGRSRGAGGQKGRCGGDCVTQPGQGPIVDDAAEEAPYCSNGSDDLVNRGGARGRDICRSRSGMLSSTNSARVAEAASSGGSDKAPATGADAEAGDAEMIAVSAGAQHSGREGTDNCRGRDEVAGPDAFVPAIAATPPAVSAGVSQAGGGVEGSRPEGAVAEVFHPFKGGGRGEEVKANRQPSPASPSSPIEIIGQVIPPPPPPPPLPIYHSLSVFWAHSSVDNPTRPPIVLHTIRRFHSTFPSCASEIPSHGHPSPHPRFPFLAPGRQALPAHRRIPCHR